MHIHKEYIENLIPKLERIINSTGKISGLNSPLTTTLLRSLLPYKAEASGKGKIILFNRDYSPVYGFGLTPKDFSFDSNKKEQYFFTDSSQPWKSKKDFETYLLKLKNFLE